MVHLLQIVEDVGLQMLLDELGSRSSILWLLILLADLERLRAVVQYLLFAARYLVAHDVHLSLQVRLEDLLRLLEVLLLLARRVDCAALDEVVGVQGPRDQILP